MKNLYDYDAQASNSLYGGDAATRAAGLPTQAGMPGTFAPGASQDTAGVLERMRSRNAELLAGMSAPQPRAAQLGYNQQTNELFSGGKVFKLDLNEARAADRAGLLDVDNPQLPAGFAPVRADDVRSKLQKDFESQGMGSDALRRLGTMGAGFGSTMRDLGIPGGQALEQAGADLAARNPSQINTAGDILAKPGVAVGEALGEGVVDAGRALAFGAAGAKVGTALAPVTAGLSIPLGAILGGAVGMFLPTLFETYGSVRREQREQGIDDKGRALAAGAGSAALETALGPEAAIGRMLVKKTGAVAARDLLKEGALKSVGKGAALGAVTEGPLTEVPQSAIERWGAAKALTGEDALNEYLISGFKGAVSGGAMTSVTGSVEYQQAKAFANNLLRDQQLAADINAPSPVRIAAAKRVQDVLRGASDDPQFDQQLQEFRQKLARLENLMVSASTRDALKNGTPTSLIQDRTTHLPKGQTQINTKAPTEYVPEPPPVYGRAPKVQPVQPEVPLEQVETLRAADIQGPLAVTPLQAPGEIQGPAAPTPNQRLLADLPAINATMDSIMNPGPLPTTEPLTPLQQQFAQGPFPPTPVTGGLTPTQQKFVEGPSAFQPNNPLAGIDLNLELPSAPVAPAPAAEPLIQVETRPSPPPAAAPAAALPAAPAVGVSSKKPRKRKAVEPATDAELQRLLDQSMDLEASVESPANMRVAGRPTLTTGELQDVRTALLSPSATTDGISARAQRLADAARAAAKAYYKYLNAGGNLGRIPQSETKSRAKGKEGTIIPSKFGQKTPAAQREDLRQRTDKAAPKLQALLDEVTAAMTELGQAAGNNAKNVEVVVRLVKDMVQKKLAIEFDDVNDGRTDAGEAGYSSTGGKLDAMLSQLWSAAKYGMFTGGTDSLYVRQQALRDSQEMTEAGVAGSPIERAAEGIAADYGKGDSYTGMLGVLTYIEMHGTPFERKLAAGVKDALYNSKYGEPTLKFITSGKPNYDPNTNTISIRADESVAVTLHESLHAALQWFVYNNPKHESVKALKASLKQVIDYKGDLGAKAKAVQDLLKKLVAKKNELDAVLELISYGNTLVEFRKAMQDMPSKGTPKTFFDAVNNLWQSILSSVKALLGSEQSVAADVIANTFKLLEAASTAKSADVAKMKKAGGNVLENTISTTTEAFKRWFGDSKVVDKSGKPLVVYHGTNSSFSVFDKGLLGSNTKAVSARKGFFFAGNPDTSFSYLRDPDAMGIRDNVALRYALETLFEQSPYNENTFTLDTPDGRLYYSVENTGSDAHYVMQKLEGSDDGWTMLTDYYDTREDAMRAANKAFFEEWGDKLASGGNPNIMPVYLAIQNPLRYDMKGAKYREVTYADLIARAQREGRDGVVIENTYDGGPKDTIYVVFDPTQIKSAIGNNGNYDPRSGNILEAAITADGDTVANGDTDEVAQSKGYADAREYRTTPASKLNITRLFMERAGLGEGGKVTAKIEAGLAKAAAGIRKNMPALERTILLLAPTFGSPDTLVALNKKYKTQQNTAVLQMEYIADYINAHPDLALPILNYMDGDKKALDKLPNGTEFKQADKLKAMADLVLDNIKTFIDALPNGSTERRLFEGLKFSEYLLHPQSISQLASKSFGQRRLGELLAVTRRTEQSLDAFKSFLHTENGVVSMDRPMYQLFETKDGKRLPFGFIDKERADNNPPAGLDIDTTRAWRFERYAEGDYRFVSRAVTATQTRTLAKDKEIDKLSAAMLNTVAALSHNYAGSNFFAGLDRMGVEDSERTETSAVFDSVEDINKVFGKNKGPIITDANVLKVSSDEARMYDIREKVRRTGTWVKLPNTPTYGPLAGKYMKGPVWNAMLDMHDRNPIVSSRAFNAGMQWFKKAKTVYSPATIANNILSNYALMLLHGVSHRSVGTAANLLRKFEFAPKSLTPKELELVKAFYDSGAVLGQFSTSEAKETIASALAAELTPANDKSLFDKLAALTRYEKKIATALEAAKRRGENVDAAATAFYAAGDNVFRFAAFLQMAGDIQARDGATTLTKEAREAAGIAARNMFLDYDIDSRAVRMARQTALPFISWTYAILPVLGRIALHKPWALVNMMVALAIMESVLGGEDDEELRKAGPAYLRDKAITGHHLFIRIPFLGDDQNPVYYNIGKSIPFFSLFEPSPAQVSFAGQSWWPSGLTPSGPYLSVLGAVAFGVDPFTGKSIQAPTASSWEKFGEVARVTYDAFTAPVLSSRNIDKTMQLMDGTKTLTGRDPDALFLARAAGLSLYGFNVDESRVIQNLAVKKIQREFATAMRTAARDEARKGVPDYAALDKHLAELRTRMEEAMAKAKGEE